MSATICPYRDTDVTELGVLVDAIVVPMRISTAESPREFLAEPDYRRPTDLFVMPGKEGNQLLGARDVRPRSRGDGA